MANKKKFSRGESPKYFLQIPILERFLSEKALKDLIEQYVAARKVYHRGRAATPLDRKVLADYKGGMILSELVEKYNRGRGSIMLSIVLASKE